ncbi:transcription antitermination protein NusB [Prochlorococcus marinus]|uniref:Antitermination protein NusB n=1 Tax=Prochlorococcus marinus (strain MIT 9211) TaxID=93059 RepID=A9B9K6_PROM4|nr:transcription antitermination protein NusB [Prochlorococcus marinus]ABX07939.1 Antitermination protein NusB [Prochlorococcus marinus str. MIT 9211]
MQSRSISREIALLVLGQISDKQINNIEDISLEDLLMLGLETLMNHLREQLDFCAVQLESAQEQLLDSELESCEKTSASKIRNHLETSLNHSRDIINSLSDSLELTTLLALSDQVNIREDAIQRVSLVLQNLQSINLNLDEVMDGWRLKRLPRIDQDILRLAYIDIHILNAPIAVACNEAVNLGNKYSDKQGRRMINGILRRLQNSDSINIA